MFADRQLACGRGRLSGARILIAEDAWLIAEALSLLLEEEGAKVVGPSATAAEAIELLGENDVNIALIDMSLQDAFADTLVDELLARKVPYMILTGFGALPTNADQDALMVLRKPIDKVALIDILSGFVAART